jgi:hypothetical protein
MNRVYEMTGLHGVDSVIWKRLRQWMAAGLLALCGILIWPSATGDMILSHAGYVAGAQSQAGVIRVAPSPAQIETGELVTVEIWVDDVVGYYGIELRARFNPDRVTVPSANCTPLWDVFDAQNHFIVSNVVDNATGEFQYVVLNLNPAEPFSGSGRICSITFMGLEDGISSLEIYHAKASDRDATPLWPSRGITAMIWIGEIEQVFLPVVG